MPFFILQSVAPQGLVLPEHAAFLCELTSNLRLNGFDVGLDVSTIVDPLDSFDAGRARAAVRQADFLWRIAWNTWGPIGNDRGMGIYTAAITTMVSMVPNVIVSKEETEAIKHQLGDVDAIVFDTPVDHVCTYCQPLGGKVFKTPMRRYEGNPSHAGFEFVARAPMSISRIGVGISGNRIVEASVKSYLLSPQNRQTLSCTPEHW